LTGLANALIAEPTDAVQKHANSNANGSVCRGSSSISSYDYVVLDDPDGSGFLVYALRPRIETG